MSSFTWTIITTCECTNQFDTRDRSTRRWEPYLQSHTDWEKVTPHDREDCSHYFDTNTTRVSCLPRCECLLSFGSSSLLFVSVCSPVWTVWEHLCSGFLLKTFDFLRTSWALMKVLQLILRQAWLYAFACFKHELDVLLYGSKQLVLFQTMERIPAIVRNLKGMSHEHHFFRWARHPIWRNVCPNRPVRCVIILQYYVLAVFTFRSDV